MVSPQSLLGGLRAGSSAQMGRLTQPLGLMMALAIWGWVLNKHSTPDKSEFQKTANVLFVAWFNIAWAILIQRLALLFFWSSVLTGILYVYLLNLTILPLWESVFHSSMSWFCCVHWFSRASQVDQTIRKLPAMQKTQIWSLGWKDSLKKGMAPHSSILGWRIPWTNYPFYYSMQKYKKKNELNFKRSCKSILL